jgi:uncharacterized protein (DUF302 family)
MRTVVSSSGHPETLARLLAAVERRGLKLFAQFDHTAAAQEVGLEMAPEVVVVFGNARAGTPLMLGDPRIGIEFPLRMLVWDAGEETLVGHKDPRELARSYDVGSHGATLEAMSSLLEELAREAAGETG